MSVVYKSNKAKVGDGMRITRVSGGGAVFEVWTGSAWSEVELKADAAPPSPDPTPVPDPDPVTPPPDPVPTPPINNGVNVVGAAELVTALKNAKGGETFVAKASPYGAVKLASMKLPSKVTVIGETGAHFESLQMAGCANLRFERLSVWPDKVLAPANVGLIHADAASSDISAAWCDVRSAVDADGYYDWDLAMWKAKVANGIFLLGQRCAIESNTMTALNFGMQIGGAGSRMTGNAIAGFSEDAIRLVGNGSGYKIADNDVVDCLSISGGARHPDGFQAWSRIGNQAVGTGLLDNIVVSRNRWREWIGPAQCAAAAIRIPMQVIGWHNGTYANTYFVENEGWTSTWWGLHLHNCDGADIVRNRFFDIGRQNKQFGRIYADGTSKNIRARDNLSGDQKYPAGSVTSGNAAPDYGLAPQMPISRPARK